MQFRQPYQKTVYRPISFRWKLGELKTYYFPEDWSWNWSSRHVEHSFDNSINLLVARSPGQFDRNFETELQHCDFLEENTHFGPLWIEKAGLRTKFFHRLFWKNCFKISRLFTSSSFFRTKTCFLKLISWSRRMLLWKPCRYFFVESAKFFAEYPE